MKIVEGNVEGECVVVEPKVRPGRCEGPVKKVGAFEVGLSLRPFPERESSEKGAGES